MSFNSYTPPGWWDRTRFMRYAFVAGLLVGVFMGWFFHGIISMVIQFGVVMLLLLPLAVLAFMWWRSSRERKNMQSSMTVMRWSPGQFPRYGNGSDMAADPFAGLDADDVFDLDDQKRQEHRR
jgi:cbb3-type cytochrome oxidase subunit 3